MQTVCDTIRISFDKLSNICYVHNLFVYDVNNKVEIIVHTDIYHDKLAS